jgi:hypothetical protein
MADVTQRWNGIPDDPHVSGWHWIAFGDWLAPKYWHAGRGYWRGGSPGQPPPWPGSVEYLGPCAPPRTP